MKNIAFKFKVCSRYILLAVIFLMSEYGFGYAQSLHRDDFPVEMFSIIKNKYQARVVCNPIEDTIWVYLPYTPGRSGLSASKAQDKTLFLEYKVSSINPYKVIEPPELKFVVQKIIGDIRNCMLDTINPYKFFVLVVTDIQTPKNPSEQWYIGYIDDIKRYMVGADFSGEGYSRLVWHQQALPVIKDKDGNDISVSYQDINGTHINYHAVTMKEFVEKQINWRIYKRFTVNYNKVPFNLSSGEKRDEVFFIIKTVFDAYDFKDFENIAIRDMSFTEEQASYIEFTREDIEKYKGAGLTRKPSF